MSGEDERNETTAMLPDANITLQDVAERCSVTKMTVARALSGWKGVSKARAEEIRAVAEEMGYDGSKHEQARRLAYRKRKEPLPPNYIASITIPSENLTDGFFGNLFHGVLKELTTNGYSTIVVPIEALSQHSEYPKRLRRGEVDGLIATGGEVQLRHFQTIYGNRQAPTVCMITALPEVSLITTDDESGSYASAMHLLSLGHRHILQFVFPNEFNFRLGERITSLEQTSNSLDRIRGIRRAMAEYGLDPEVYHHLLHLWLPSLAAERVRRPIQEISEHYQRFDNDQPIAEYIRNHPEVTAILGHNDANAMHAWYLVQRLGLRVPEDISIIGFDDTDPMFDAEGRNILTSVARPLFDVGREAARCLLAHIRNELAYPTHKVLPTKLIIRNSTAARRSR